MMIDFQTRTLAFSNCGSRLVPVVCCWSAPTPTPAAKTAAMTPPITHLDLIEPPHCQPLRQTQQPGRIAALDRRALVAGDIDSTQRHQHLRNAADLMGVVAPGENAIG